MKGFENPVRLFLLMWQHSSENVFLPSEDYLLTDLQLLAVDDHHFQNMFMLETSLIQTFLFQHLFQT